MWLDIIAAVEEKVPTPPPDIPFEQIGIVLVAVVTGLTAIIVAIIQRGGKKNETPAPAPVAPLAPGAGPVFVIPKDEWEKVRDGFVRLDTEFSRLRSEYDIHERWTVGEVREMDNEVSRMKGHLGMP